jgi:hypothetical protein
MFDDGVKVNVVHRTSTCIIDFCDFDEIAYIIWSEYVRY